MDRAWLAGPDMDGSKEVRERVFCVSLTNEEIVEGSVLGWRHRTEGWEGKLEKRLRCSRVSYLRTYNTELSRMSQIIELVRVTMDISLPVICTFHFSKDARLGCEWILRKEVHRKGHHEI